VANICVQLHDVQSVTVQQQHAQSSANQPVHWNAYVFKMKDGSTFTVTAFMPSEAT
jgi:hypothetical protein